MLEGLLKYLSSEGRVVFKAPLVFLTALVICCGIEWAVMTSLYSSRIDAYESRLKLRDDQISDYKSKLSGATPDEAKKRMDNLEAQILAMSPRRLTNEQKDALLSSIKFRAGVVQISQDMAVPDARQFAAELAHQFISAGWKVSTPMVMGISNPPPSGVALKVADPASMSFPAAEIKAALEKAKIDFDLEGGLPKDSYDQSSPVFDAEIIVTSR